MLPSSESWLDLPTRCFYQRKCGVIVLTVEDADLDISAKRDTNCAEGGMEGQDIAEFLRNCPAPIR